MKYLIVSVVFTLTAMYAFSDGACQPLRVSSDYSPEEWTGDKNLTPVETKILQLYDGNPEHANLETAIVRAKKFYDFRPIFRTSAMGNEAAKEALDKILGELGAAAAKGDARAELVLAHYYYELEFFNKSLPYARSAAAKGLGDAIFFLYERYGDGYLLQNAMDAGSKKAFAHLIDDALKYNDFGKADFYIGEYAKKFPEDREGFFRHALKPYVKAREGKAAFADALKGMYEAEGEDRLLYAAILTFVLDGASEERAAYENALSGLSELEKAELLVKAYAVILNNGIYRDKPQYLKLLENAMVLGSKNYKVYEDLAFYHTSMDFDDFAGSEAKYGTKMNLILDLLKRAYKLAEGKEKLNPAYYLFEIYRLTDDREAAGQWLKTAFELDPLNKKYKLAEEMADAFNGGLYGFEKDKIKAEECKRMQKSLEDPNAIVFDMYEKNGKYVVEERPREETPSNVMTADKAFWHLSQYDYERTPSREEAERCFQKFADNPAAQHQYAMYLMRQNDWKRAAELLEESANLEIPLSMIFMYGFYSTGQGVEKDDEKAKYWADKSLGLISDVSDDLYFECSPYVFRHMFKEWGVYEKYLDMAYESPRLKNKVIARRYFELMDSKDPGDVEKLKSMSAEAKIAFEERKSISRREDFLEKFGPSSEVFQNASKSPKEFKYESENPELDGIIFDAAKRLFLYGMYDNSFGDFKYHYPMMMFYGICTEKDMPGAVKIMKKLDREQKCIPAKAFLAYCYENGYGVEADKEKAVQYRKDAMEYWRASTLKDFWGSKPFKGIFPMDENEAKYYRDRIHLIYYDDGVRMVDLDYYLERGL